jgi:hypothetical protein
MWKAPVHGETLEYPPPSQQATARKRLIIRRVYEYRRSVYENREVSFLDDDHEFSEDDSRVADYKYMTEEMKRHTDPTFADTNDNRHHRAYSLVIDNAESSELFDEELLLMDDNRIHVDAVERTLLIFLHLKRVGIANHERYFKLQRVEIDWHARTLASTADDNFEVTFRQLPSATLLFDNLRVVSELLHCLLPVKEMQLCVLQFYIAVHFL